MGKQQKMDLIQGGIDAGNCTYESLGYVTSVLKAAKEIAADQALADSAKLRRLEGLIKTALYLTYDVAGFVDSETTGLSEQLTELSGGRANG